MFTSYITEQAAKISNNTLEGEPIEVGALLSNNGWFDPLVQYEASLHFATDAPGYEQLQNDTILAKNQSFFGACGCKEHLLSQYSECSYNTGVEFRLTGDEARSTLPTLGALADSGLKILVWAGDADIK
ncbi:hypothetical protein BD413DRAFT_617406 [Trametes elegans]|nr:hypothetical protein BD413DRAFT_617406 [Trametes elegans]